MFNLLVSEVASRLNLGTPAVTSLVRGLLSMMTSERDGGIKGFIDRFRHAGLDDVVASWFGGKEGRSITATQVESALGASAVDKLASGAGLTRQATTSAVAALLPKLIGSLTPTGVLPSSSALLSQASSYLETPAVTTSVHREERRGWPRWLPWAAAALLALAAWMWLRQPAGTIDPQLTLSNRDGKVTYSGLVRDEATRTAIVGGLRTAFGETNVEGDLRVDPNVKRVAWLPRLGDLFAALKSPGVEFSLNGDALSLGGWLSTADRQALTDKLQGIFGAQSAIGSLADAAVDAVRTANDKALSALNALGTTVTADALVSAMNLSVINFASGSAEIPADGLAVVRTSAEAIKRAPASTRIEIGGHTDNTGDAASNVSLSQARADAVKTALVAAGVAPEILSTKGYGDSKPRASNDTEYGRFQNRRIEYAVVQ